MPTVYNGIGTWYYGKERIHRLKDTCSFCNNVGELESYDTTLYFVVLFVPIFPLGRKRVIESCPACQKHRAASLKQWEEGKRSDIAALMERLEQDPDDRDAVLHALGLSMAYQDEALFNKLAPALASDRHDDAAIQAALAHAYNFFARYGEAEAAFRAALAVDDDPALREQLALTLLKQGRPAEAEPLVRHILDGPLEDRAGMIYVLVEGYQAEGMHREALALMDRRDAAFPELAELKDYKKQRKVSEKHQQTGKRIKSAYLSESAQVGYHEGGWTARVPKLVGPLLLLGLFLWYLFAAVSAGQARQIHFVNGTDKPYTIAVNGQERRLPPGVTPLTLAEGSVAIEPREGAAAVEPMTVRVATPFLTRPFVKHTVVINPDQLALVMWEENVYSQTPREAAPAEFFLGEPLYTFRGVNYEFSEFPHSIKAKRNSAVTKTRVALAPALSPTVRAMAAMQILPPEDQIAFARRLVRAEPENRIYLAWLITLLPESEQIDFLEPGLAARPLRVDWHRAYQSLMERQRPESDLRPEYRRLADELKDDPDALYLLGRIEDHDAGEALLRRAAAAAAPSFHAMTALGYRGLASGEFSEAADWLAKAAANFADDPHDRQLYWSALQAAGRDEPLLAELKGQRQQPELQFRALVEQIRLHAARGENEQAQALIAEGMRSQQDPYGVDSQGLRHQFEAVRACGQGDRAAFVEHASKSPGLAPLETALLQGKLAEAAGAADERSGDVGAQALVALAALKAKDGDIAERQQKSLAETLSKSDRDGRRMGEWLQAEQPPDVEEVRKLPLDASEKRILVALLAERHPAQREPLVELARRLNFQRDAAALCLQALLDN